MCIIIDLILVAVIVFSIILAAKKGFIATTLNLVAIVTALVLSVILCTPVSEYINKNYVNPYVKGYILGVIDNSSIGKNYDEAVSKVDVSDKIEEMPQKLREVITLAGIDVDQIIEKAEDAKDTAYKTKDNLINAIAEPISITISKVISLVLLLIVLGISLWFVAKIIASMFNMISFGKKINVFGGMIFGMIRGLAIILVICSLFSSVTKTVPVDSNNIFSKKTIDNTILLKRVINLNPLDSIINIK